MADTITFRPVRMPEGRLPPDFLSLSTWLVAPTSTSAREATFRPQVDVSGQVARVLAEQTASVDPSRLGEVVGYLALEEPQRGDAALRLVLSL